MEEFVGPHAPPPDAPGEQPELSREQTHLLVQLATVVARARAYPESHPLLMAALDQLRRLLDAALQGRAALVIGVASDHLLVDAAGSDPDHPVLRELAARLHRHQLASLTIRDGIEAAELGDLARAVGGDGWRQGKPLGLEPPDALHARWPHADLDPLPLDQLVLADPAAAEQDRAERARALWEQLVQVALSGATGPAHGGDGRSAAAGALPSAAAVAGAIRIRSTDPAYCQAVIESLMELGEKFSPLDRPSPAQDGVADLFTALDGDTLDRLLELGATARQRRELVHRSARTLPIKAVLALLQSAARGSGRDLSHALLTMLTKLASQAVGEAGTGEVPEAAGVFRDSVRQLVGGWADDAEAAPHRQLLALLGRPGAGERHPGARVDTPALRMVSLGLELGIRTPALDAAARTLVDTTSLDGVLDLIDRAEGAGHDPGALVALLADPATLRTRLLDTEIELDSVRRLLDRLGDAAADPLLEALEASTSASRRRAIIRRLSTFGARLGPILVARLPGKPWFVQRNLLGLLATLDVVPPGFNAFEYARHANPKVRREAYKLLFASPAERPAAILAAATDPDGGIAHLALATAADDPPAELVRQLPTLLNDRLTDPEARAAAIRLLSLRPTVAGRDWLLAQVATRRGWLWFRRDTLRARSPEMLAALAALARGYGQYAGIAATLRLAGASSDPDVRAAARPEHE